MKSDLSNIFLLLVLLVFHSSLIHQEHLYLCSGVKEVYRKVTRFYSSFDKTVVAAAKLYLKGMDILSVRYQYHKDEILRLINHFCDLLTKWINSTYTDTFSTSLNEPEVQKINLHSFMFYVLY